MNRIKQTLTISFELRRTPKNKNTNQIITANDTLNRFERAAIVKRLRRLSKIKTLEAMKSNNITEYITDVDITIQTTAFDKRRRDAMNLAPTFKALIDGMTDAKLWTDDNDDIINSIKIERSKFEKTNKTIKITMNLQF